MKAKPLGDLERKIMEIIWESEEAISVSDVVQVLSQKRKIAYTTVMTIMGRLVDKGILTRKLSGSSYQYMPKVSQEKFIAKSVHNIFTTAVSTLGQEAVAYFVKEIKRLNPKKRQELLKMLDE